ARPPFILSASGGHMRQHSGRLWSLAAALAAVLAAGPAPPAAAQAERTNPLAGSDTAIRQGRNIYRGRCAVCHGVDGKGYRGSDLTTGDWVHGGADEQLFRTISLGVPGTEMPPHPNVSDEEIWMLISYIRTLVTPGGAAADTGNAARGEELFWSRTAGNCGQCHMIGPRGGRLGPNLTRIGASRSAAALAREIRTPTETIPVGFETITVVTKDGTRIRGVRKNEDTFSVQVMTPAEDVLSFWKRDVEVISETERSLMPAYGPERLSDADLADIVRYLRAQRGLQGGQR
ncbi:MAG: c-type cytochrome, partial [Acidobacteriota bacterium]